jgi:hypothetical protein
MTRERNVGVGWAVGEEVGALRVGPTGQWWHEHSPTCARATLGRHGAGLWGETKAPGGLRWACAQAGRRAGPPARRAA